MIFMFIAVTILSPVSPLIKANDNTQINRRQIIFKLGKISNYKSN